MTGPKCPNCGTPLPSDAPEGVCPICAVRETLLDEDAGNFSDLSWIASEGSENPLSNTIPTPGTGVPGPPLRSSRSKFRNPRIIRWLVIFASLLIVSYSSVRFAWILTHPRPSILLTDELSPAFDSVQLGLPKSARLIQVNDTPVSSTTEVREAYDAVSNDYYKLLFSSGNEIEQTLDWIQLPPAVTYRRSETGGIVIPSSIEAVAQIPDGASEIVSINGVEADEITVDAEGIVTIPKPVAEILTFQRLSINESGGAGERIVIVDSYSAYRNWSRLIVGIGLLAIGVLVFWFRYNTLGGIGFLFFAFFCGVFSLLRSLHLWHRTEIENIAYGVAQCAIPASVIVFLLTFTPLRQKIQRPYRWMLSAIGASILFWLANKFANANLSAVGLLSSSFFRFWALSLLILFAFGLSTNLWVHLSRLAATPTDRQRARVLQLAMLFGFGPSVLGSVFFLPLVPNGLGTETLRAGIDATVLLFPLIIAYAIIRHNLLQLSDLAKEGLIYGILLSIMTSIFAAGLFLLVPVLELWFPESRSIVQSGLTAAAFLVVLPAHNYTRKKITQVFRRVPLEFDEFITRVENSPEAWSSSAMFCNVVAKLLGEITKTPHVAIFLHHRRKSQWTLSALTPDIRTAVTTDVCKEVLDLVAREQSEIYRDDALEVLEYTPIRQNLLEGFKILDASVFLPLVSQDGLVGAISIGEKSNHTNLSGGELRVLKRIARYVANTLQGWQTRGTTKGDRIADKWPDVPERIGGYTIERVLGEGGMSHVFLGSRDRALYAIKVANRMVQNDPKLMERFHREASAIQRIDHPNIVKVMEVGWEDAEPFIVLEYFAHGSLERYIKPGNTLSVGKVLSMSLQIARGLAAAHQHGIIHRDIKPHNIFEADQGTVKIGDFGLAKLGDRTTLTMAGDLFGTPDYMAPELLQGHKGSIQSDQYALGVMMYEMLTGEKPFSGDSMQAVMYQRVHIDAPNPNKVRSDLDEGIGRIVEKLLNKDPEDRFETYEQLMAALTSAFDRIDPEST